MSSPQDASEAGNHARMTTANNSKLVAQNGNGPSTPSKDSDILERVIGRHSCYSRKLPEEQIQDILLSLPRNPGVPLPRRVRQGQWHEHLLNVLRMEFMRSGNSNKKSNLRRTSHSMLGALLSKLQEAYNSPLGVAQKWNRLNNNNKIRVLGQQPIILLDDSDSEEESSDDVKNNKTDNKNNQNDDVAKTSGCQKEPIVYEIDDSDSDEDKEEGEVSNNVARSVVPDRQAKYPTSTMAAAAAPDAALHHPFGSLSTPPMGRGRHTTLPAWHTAKTTKPSEDASLHDPYPKRPLTPSIQRDPSLGAACAKRGYDGGYEDDNRHHSSRRKLANEEFGAVYRGSGSHSNGRLDRRNSTGMATFPARRDNRGYSPETPRFYVQDLVPQESQHATFALGNMDEPTDTIPNKRQSLSAGGDGHRREQEARGYSMPSPETAAREVSIGVASDTSSGSSSQQHRTIYQPQWGRSFSRSPSASPQILPGENRDTFTTTEPVVASNTMQACPSNWTTSATASTRKRNSSISDAPSAALSPAAAKDAASSSFAAPADLTTREPPPSNFDRSSTTGKTASNLKDFSAGGGFPKPSFAARGWGSATNPSSSLGSVPPPPSSTWGDSRRKSPSAAAAAINSLDSKTQEANNDVTTASQTTRTTSDKHFSAGGGFPKPSFAARGWGSATNPSSSLGSVPPPPSSTWDDSRRKSPSAAAAAINSLDSKTQEANNDVTTASQTTRTTSDKHFSAGGGFPKPSFAARGWGSATNPSSSLGSVPPPPSSTWGDSRRKSPSAAAAAINSLDSKTQEANNDVTTASQTTRTTSDKHFSAGGGFPKPSFAARGWGSATNPSSSLGSVPPPPSSTWGDSRRKSPSAAAAAINSLDSKTQRSQQQRNHRQSDDTNY
ncbi:hypothetical protein ACA910_013421 [Epithemia clementina (nom. ined.)]